MSSHEEAARPAHPDGGSDASGHFVNHLTLTLTLSEVRFELSRLGSRLPPARTWRFITSPDHMLTMQRGFTAAVESYRRRYGDIRAAPVDRGSVTFDEGHGDG